MKEKRLLKSKLKIKIKNKKNNIIIDGKAENEYIAEQVLNAIDFGFPAKIAVLITEEDLIFEKIYIKKLTKKQNMKAIRARIIGKKGKTLNTLQNLSNCYIILRDEENEIGIIGRVEDIKNLNDAIESLVKGSKQGNVYAFLEKNQSKPELDLGLK